MSRRGPLRVLVAVVYLALAVGALLAAAPALRVWLLIALRPAVLPPRLPPLVPWLAATLAILGGLYFVLQALFAGRPVPKVAAVSLLVGATGIFAAAALLPRAAVIPAGLPRGRLDGALDAAVARLEAAHRNGGHYPARFPGGPLRDRRGHRLYTGCWGHGRRLPFHVVSRPPGDGPAVRARAGDGPGTLYYVASPQGDRYWLTALLLDGQPVGAVRFVRTAEGRALVVRGPLDRPGSGR